METTANKTTATLLQLSALTQYFFPFGNFIFPVLIWSAKKNESEFVDYNGKQAINFQLSLFIYAIVIVIISIPVFIYCLFSSVDFAFLDNSDWVIESNSRWVVENFDTEKIPSLIAIAAIVGFILVVMKIAEFFLIIYSAVKNSNGIKSNYPFTIKFIK
ncbi:DUF4870 domain-containing protein [Flavobacterium subsaxonicum]|uniref:DUF4870 domain-containing protein n=1 Tax=Flavobacterium subsaxonicum WB 4.1-42 = DSM 21790 TaxID=1121898 RepID=A0A0A2MIH7_9FLAO|nr:DUF4870 domain-containing protein [Flavobacterium subsaxonicum]KGO92447.1 hypothetical protein Q766_13400 [Flavobacterium subsaxonicum WB 4.1-42 = DSM 21790]